jgi:hypothetical protein
MEIDKDAGGDRDEDIDGWMDGWKHKKLDIKTVDKSYTEK